MSPEQPTSCSALRTSTGSPPHRRTCAQCSANEPCSARTPIFVFVFGGNAGGGCDIASDARERTRRGRQCRRRRPNACGHGHVCGAEFTRRRHLRKSVSPVPRFQHLIAHPFRLTDEHFFLAHYCTETPESGHLAARRRGRTIPPRHPAPHAPPSHPSVRRLTASSSSYSSSSSIPSSRIAVARLNKYSRLGPEGRRRGGVERRRWRSRKAS